VTTVNAGHLTETIRAMAPGAEPVTARALPCPGVFEVRMTADDATRLGFHPTVSHCWRICGLLGRRLGVTVEVTQVRHTRRSRVIPSHTQMACITLIAAGGR
jgi:hypothetical protein